MFHLTAKCLTCQSYVFLVSHTFLAVLSEAYQVQLPPKHLHHYLPIANTPISDDKALSEPLESSLMIDP